MSELPQKLFGDTCSVNGMSVSAPRMDTLLATVVASSSRISLQRAENNLHRGALAVHAI